VPRGATKRRPATVNALLDAALELFAEQGFGATSIPDISRRAGLTKGAFYSNFANKDALFLALLDRSWARRAEWLRRAVSAVGTGAAGPEEGTPAPTSGVDKQWTLVSVEFSLHAIRRPEVAALLVEHEVRVRSELAVLVAEALEREGRVPIVPVLDLARMIVAVSEGGDIQALTDGAGGATVHEDLARRAVAALLAHFSAPNESVLERADDLTSSPSFSTSTATGRPSRHEATEH
jgi:AcrR family transcriptional regulator